MQKKFRIHGDNIVECERIVKIIINEIQIIDIKTTLTSPSSIMYIIKFNYLGNDHEWVLELLPGFNKAGRNRWESDIFTCLKNNGSFLDETPDVIVTNVENGCETILLAVEFCSALQAGNQAWQRSGRAFSVGRTGCPYLYIVDFVKYELDSQTRKRKALRFPNPAVPYSYINFSKQCNNFIAQIYIRSEEYNKDNKLLSDFNDENFAETELARYIVKRMCGFDTNEEEAIILQKNLNVVQFLASKTCSKTNFTSGQWEQLYLGSQDSIDFTLKHSTFNFQKTITEKGQYGKSIKFLELVKKYSIGIASKNLPFGIIPATNRNVLANEIYQLYPSYDLNILSKIGSTHSNLILCMIKGFKSGGDDNRPDRGILPFAIMLTSMNIEIMTYIYGPIIERNYKILTINPKYLAELNGFWNVILALSDYVAIDAPVLSNSLNDDAKILVDTTELKKSYFSHVSSNMGLTQNSFSNFPQSYHEDDVDTCIHFIFTHLLSNFCFEGMCNPPGGDWSGFSIRYNNKEIRWLSLPRVSIEINGKRPDHVLELFDIFERPALLVIESKERSSDLEQYVGINLKNYIINLMNYLPSVQKDINTTEHWTQSTFKVDINEFEVISAAAYLKINAQESKYVFEQSKCEMLFILEPSKNGWKIEINAATKKANILKEVICNNIKESRYPCIIIT